MLGCCAALLLRSGLLLIDRCTSRRICSLRGVAFRASPFSAGVNRVARTPWIYSARDDCGHHQLRGSEAHGLTT